MQMVPSHKDSNNGPFNGIRPILAGILGLAFLSGCAHPAPPESSASARTVTGAPALSSDPIPAMHTSVYSGTLANGLAVFIVPRPDLPVISFRIGIRAGSAEDSRGKGGMAALASSLLSHGTSSHDALSIFRIVDSSGGALESSSTRDLTIVSGDSLSPEAPTLLELAAEMVESPTFPKTEFEKKKASFIASLLDSENHPGPIGSNLFYRQIFGHGPYGHPTFGTSTSVATITREDLVRFAASHYRPNRSALVLAGDLTPERGLRLANRIFGTWAPKPSSGSTESREQRGTIPSPAGSSSDKPFLIDKPELHQSTVFYGTRGIARSNPAFYNTLVYSMLLGGSQTSTLNHVIRQKMGLVYYIHTGLDAEQKAGPFIVNFQTHAPNTRKVIVEMDRLMKQSITTPPDHKRVEAVKSQLVGGFPFLMNTTQKLASLILVVWNYNLGMTYFTDYPAKVTAITPDSVARAGKSLLSGKHFVTVIVGPAKAIGKAGLSTQPPPAS